MAVGLRPSPPTGATAAESTCSTPQRLSLPPGFVHKELIPKGGGGGGWGLGGSHKGAAYSNLIFPQPSFGSRFFWGGGGSQSQKTPPLSSYKQRLSAARPSPSGSAGSPHCALQEGTKYLENSMLLSEINICLEAELGGPGGLPHNHPERVFNKEKIVCRRVVVLCDWKRATA